MTILTKLQQTLLSHATTRESGSLLPAAETLNVAPNRARKAAGQLIELGFAEEGSVEEHAASWRTGDEVQLGAFITDAGRAVLPTEAVEVHDPCPAPDHKRATKASLLVTMLSTPEGASLDELVAATSWLPHTTRAALTGLKKKGYEVVRSGERGASRYSIGEAA